MPTKCFLLDLKNDPELIVAYREWHKPGKPPRAVMDALRAGGVREMSIYLLGTRLCMIMEADDDFDEEAKRATEHANKESAAWEVKMSRYQQPLPWAKPGEKWLEAEKIFDLGEQP
jgi:L-rhamnose mutarotase